MAPEYTPRGAPSSRSRMAMVLTFGAPVMEPAGKQAATASARGMPGRSRASMVLTIWCTVA